MNKLYNNLFFLLTIIIVVSLEISAQYLFKLDKNKNINFNFNFNTGSAFRSKYIIFGIILYALLGFFVNFMLQFDQLIIVNIIWHLMHFFILFIIGYLYFNEKLTLKKYIGIIFAIIAIILFMSDHNHSH
jgi:drug/metabolite transporter (DMT)-like permease|tara:strand:+ start:405 stop:794 length:390 start_codon:yes stop_codon:yes gene_type:complete